MKLDVLSRSGAKLLPDGLVLGDDATVDDLQAAFHAHRPKFYPSRQRFTLPPRGAAADGGGRPPPGEALAPGRTLASYGLGAAGGGAVVFKDLGPQVGYRTVYVWEYLGPLLIYPLFYFFPSLFYGGFKRVPPKGLAQTAALAYWTLHFAKREAETALVHRFSRGTMPARNLLRNCAYYWAFAAYVSYYVNHPLYTAPPAGRVLAGLGAALACQAANARCHVLLARLRPAGGRGWALPRGFLFEWISCPNYTTEVLGWVGFVVATQAAPAAVFTLAGAAQMAQWAAQKHARLRRTFDGRDGRPKYPRRWVMLPPFF